MIDTLTIQFLLGFAALLLSLLAFFGVRRIESRTGNDPRLTAFLGALAPYVNEALYAATSLAERALRDTATTLEAADKKQIADSFYTLLPDTLHIAGANVPIATIKTIVTRDKWEQLVQHAADSADARIIRNESWLWEQVDKLTGHAPPIAIVADPMPTFVSAINALGAASSAASTARNTPPDPSTLAKG